MRQQSSSFIGRFLVRQPKRKSLKTKKCQHRKYTPPYRTDTWHPLSIATFSAEITPVARGLYFVYQQVLRYSAHGTPLRPQAINPSAKYASPFFCTPPTQHRSRSPPKHHRALTRGAPSTHEPASFREGALDRYTCSPVTLDTCTSYEGGTLLTPVWSSSAHLAGDRAHAHNTRPSLQPPL